MLKEKWKLIIIVVRANSSLFRNLKILKRKREMELGVIQ